MEVEHAAYAGALAGRNMLRANGGFEIWQRDLGGAADFLFSQGTTANYQIADRWYLLANINQQTRVQQVAGIPTDGGSRYACKITRVSGQTGTGQYQLGYALDTDEAILMRGQRLCLSFWVKGLSGFSSAGGRLDFLVSCGTGAPQKRLGGMTGETMPLQGVNQLFLVPGDPAVRAFRTSTILVDTNVTSACVWFNWNPVGTAPGSGVEDSLIIDDVQLEFVGSPSQGPSPFERLLFDEELRLCQRHFFKTFPYNVRPDYNVGAGTGECRSTPAYAGADGRAGNGHALRFPVPMRADPAIETFNPEGSIGNMQVRNISAAAGHTGTTPVSSENHVAIASTGASTGAVQHHIGVHLTADAGI